MKSIKNISAPVEYCPECHSLKRKPNKDCKNHDTYWRQNEIINSKKPMLKNIPARKAKKVPKKKIAFVEEGIFDKLGVPKVS